jgi:hypothetical protein
MVKKIHSPYLLSNCFLSFMLLLQGCSSFSLSSPFKASDHRIKSIEISLSRAALGFTEFEQYKAIPEKMFLECGKIKRGRNTAEDQQIITFGKKSNDQKAIKNAANAFLDVYTSKESWNWSEPGVLNDLSDPGVVKIYIRTRQKNYQIETSLDSISNPSGRHEIVLRRLVRTVRGIAVNRVDENNGICGNKDFYSVGF